jgi:hypothetical protein
METLREAGNEILAETKAHLAGMGKQKYNIIRYYKVSGRKRIIHRNVTLEVAQLHCNDPRTAKAGIWFDGYVRV